MEDNLQPKIRMKEKRLVFLTLKGVLPSSILIFFSLVLGLFIFTVWSSLPQNR